MSTTTKNTKKEAMTYEPEAMLDYAKESGLYADMVFATMNNSYGYASAPIIGTVSVRDGEPILEYENKEGKKDFFPLEEGAEMLAGAELGGYIVSYNQEYSVVLIKCEDPSVGTDDEEYRSAMVDALLMDFFSQIGINTPNKMANLAKESRSLWEKLRKQKVN